VHTRSTLRPVQQISASTNGVNGCRTSPKGVTALLSELFFSSNFKAGKLIGVHSGNNSQYLNSRNS